MNTGEHSEQVKKIEIGNKKVHQITEENNTWNNGANEMREEEGLVNNYK